MQLAETREVRIVKQRLCRLVHPFEIQRLEDAPRIPPAERILPRVDIIFVRARSCVKARVRLRFHPPHPVHRNVRRQQPVQFVRHHLPVQLRVKVKVSHHQPRMHTGIRTSGPHHFDLPAQEGRKRLHQRFLHTRSVRLDLPAVVIRSVERQIDEIPEHTQRAVMWKQPCFSSYFT